MQIFNQRLNGCFVYRYVSIVLRAFSPIILNINPIHEDTLFNSYIDIF